MHSAKKTIAKPPLPGSIIKYGIAHAWDIYTLCELVNNQIKKGMQPVENIQAMAVVKNGELSTTYVQVMVQYATKPKRTNASTTKKMQHATRPTR